MENFLKELLEPNTKVEPKTLSESLSLNVSGVVELTKGTFKQKFDYYAQIYATNYKDTIKIDDLDITAQRECSLGKLPIDNIQDFKSSLVSNGLSTLSKRIGFTTDEEVNEIQKVIKNHRAVVALFGKKIKIWNMLSTEEQRLTELIYLVENFEKCDDYLKKSVAAYYSIDNNPDDENDFDKIIPSFEVYQMKLVELSK